jgi:NADH-quinone oxidoreductase subunit E
MQDKHVANILSKYDADRGGLISILEEVQNQYGYLPEKALREVSEETGCSLVDIYGVATFYKAFSLEPRGKHLVSVCLGTACHVRGGPRISEEFQRQLGIEPSQTTKDKMFTLQTVNCLGACALGPIVVVDGHYFSHVGVAEVKGILDKTLEGLDKVEVGVDKRIFPVEARCPRCNRSLMDDEYLIEGYPSVRLTASFGRKHGWIRLSSLYGSYTFESEYTIPEDTIINIFCPHCHTELISASNCSECGAPMVPMILSGGGVVQICPRRGCKGHMLDLSDATIG